MREKGGISLVILVITIIVAVILTGVVVTDLSSSSSSGVKSQFAVDISNIRDNIDIYYLQNGNLPVNNDASYMSQDDILNLSSNDSLKRSILLKQIEEKEEKYDDGTKGKYYIVDLGKIGITKSKYGTGKYGTNDVYVVSENRNVYYLRGIEADSKIYYTLTSELTLSTKVDESNKNQEKNQNEKRIVLKKDTSNWTNKMGINVSTNIADGEELYIDIAQIGRKKISTPKGIVNFKIDSLRDYIQSDLDVRIEGLDNDEITRFEALPNNEKIIRFILINFASTISTEEINLENYDITIPEYTMPQITYQDKNNIINFDVSDKDSGIKYVKYMYLEKYDVDNEKENLINGKEDVDFSVINTIGKTLEGISGKDQKRVAFEVEKNISKVKVLILDNAGNYFSMVININV